MYRSAQPSRFERRPEPQYAVSPYVAEWWNTLSNFPFVLVGLLRLRGPLSPLARQLYVCYTLAGVCSAFHHAAPFAWRWTLWVDWAPIATALAWATWHRAWSHLSAATVCQLGLALLVGALDHTVRLMPVPWGHVCWHLLAALAVNAALWEVACHTHSLAA